MSDCEDRILFADWSSRALGPAGVGCEHRRRRAQADRPQLRHPLVEIIVGPVIEEHDEHGSIRPSPPADRPAAEC